MTHWTDPEKTWVYLSYSSSNLLRGPLVRSYSIFDGFNISLVPLLKPPPAAAEYYLYIIFCRFAFSMLSKISLLTGCCLEPVFGCSPKCWRDESHGQKPPPTNKYATDRIFQTNPRFICLPNHTPSWKDSGFVNCRHPSIFLMTFIYLLKKHHMSCRVSLGFLYTTFSTPKTTTRPSLEPFPWTPKQRPKVPTMGATTKWHHNTRAMVGELYI